VLTDGEYDIGGEEIGFENDCGGGGGGTGAFAF